MIETEAVLRKWGRSTGVVIPKDKLEDLGAGVNDKVKIFVEKQDNPLKKLFGREKRFSKSTQELLDEVDREGWND